MRHVRLLLLVLIVVFVGSRPTAFAQLSLSLGVGPNITQLSVDFTDPDFLSQTYEPVIGFYAGLYAALDLGPLAVRSGAVFVNAGAIFNGSEFLAEDGFDVNFLTVPVDVRLSIPLKIIKPYVFGGPEFRYLLNLEDSDPGFKDNLEQLRTLGSIGAGIVINLPMIGTLAPEVRYSFDFQGLIDGDLTVRDELVRIKDSFRADMLKFGLVLGL